MRLALTLLACVGVAGLGLLACRSRLPVDHVTRPTLAPDEASSLPPPPSPPAPPPATSPPSTVQAPRLHVEYYQISDG